MRYGLTVVALLVPLSGCVVPPEPVGYGYGYPGPGVAVPYAQPDYGYPGYSYNDGSPTLFVGGATVPLIFYGGSWGYWDQGRRWHRAPDRIERQLEQRHPGGVGYRPWGGGQFGRPEGPRFGGQPGGSPWVNRPDSQPPGGGFRQGGPPPGGGFRQGGPAPAASVQPGGPLAPGMGFHPQRPAGPPPAAAVPSGGPLAPGMGFHPQGRPQPAAAPAAAGRPGSPERHRQDEHR